MGKPLKIILGLILLYVLGMGGSGLLIRAMLSGETGQRLREQARRALPVEVSIEGGDFDIAQWFLFRPSLSFDRLEVANPPGFSAEPLLTAARVSARADLSTLLGDTFEIKEIAILEPNLLIESDAKKRTNVEALLAAIESGEGAAGAPNVDEPSADSPSVVVGSFVIQNGTVRYLAAGEPPMIVKNLDVRVDDFDPAASFPLTVSLDLFQEEAVHLTYSGHSGPFRPDSSPAKGALSIEALPARLPERFRVDRLGEFIVSPGAASRLNLDVELNGDLLDDFSGDGRIRFTDIRLGKAEEKQLPLQGEAPVSLTIRNALANPSWLLRMPEATLQLGAGTWTGRIDLEQGAGRIAGRSSGAIQGVDVNELLTALTDSEDVVFGLLELERYDVQFTGRDAEEIQNSLRGSGRLDLVDGKLAVFDTLKTIEQKINKVLKGDQSIAEGVTSFVRAGTDFTIADRRVSTPNLMLENDSASLGGSGSFGFDMDLDYDISSLISGPLAAALGGTKNAEGIAELAAPLRLTGTVDSPKVFLDIKSLAKAAAVGQAKSFLGGLLRRRSSEAATDEAAAEGEQPVDAAAADEEAKPEKKLPFGLGDALNKALGGKQAPSEEAGAEPKP